MIDHFTRYDPYSLAGIV